jgi:CDP-diacylglycerol--serine O-phosphatidyltransferase
MIWRQVIPISFTLSAMLAGFFSMLMSAAGEYVQAAQLIMLSMVLDGLDGTLARVLKGTTKIGAELDTFVDMTSFGLAPAMLAYQAVLKDFELWGLLVVSAVVLSGVLRLSRFRIVDPFRGQRGYLGLPITVCGGWITLFVLATEIGVLDDAWFNLHRGPMANLVWTSVLAFTVLQVSHVRYIKPTKDPAVMSAGVFLTAMLFLGARFAVASALTICAYGFFYAFISPFFKRQHVALDEESESERVRLRHL